MKTQERTSQQDLYDPNFRCPVDFWAEMGQAIANALIHGGCLERADRHLARMGDTQAPTPGYLSPKEEASGYGK